MALSTAFLMKNELQSIWKKAVILLFKAAVLFRNFPELKKTTKNLTYDSGSPGRDLQNTQKKW
jgi:hypothetical protein